MYPIAGSNGYLTIIYFLCNGQRLRVTVDRYTKKAGKITSAKLRVRANFVNPCPISVPSFAKV